MTSPAPHPLAPLDLLVERHCAAPHSSVQDGRRPVHVVANLHDRRVRRLDRYFSRYIVSLDRMTRYLTRAPIRSRSFSLWFVRAPEYGLSDVTAAMVNRWVGEDRHK